MLLIAFAPEALRCRTTAVEREHALLTEADRFDERSLGGPIPRFPLVEGELGERSGRHASGRPSLAAIMAADCWAICVTVMKWLLTICIGWSWNKSRPPQSFANR